MFSAISLAKKGYFNGNPSLVMEAPVDVVIAIFNYEKENNKYEECQQYLAKQDG